ncbi:MAG: creatininase family protein, partial [Acidobacteriota bacterium]
FEGSGAVADGGHLERRGFRLLVIANAHLDPTHLASLHAAVDAAAAEAPALDVVFPDVTRKPWARRLTEEFKSGACHAGRYEGSIVMASRPDLVRSEVAGRLPANPSSLVTAIRDGARTFEDAGGPRAYFGAPAEATAAEGERTVLELGAILADAVDARLRDAPQPPSPADS